MHMYYEENKKNNSYIIYFKTFTKQSFHQIYSSFSPIV